MALDRRQLSGGYLPLRDAIDRLFEGSFTPQFFSGGAGFPPADLYSTDDSVVIEMAVPGASPDDINVSVTGDTVTISGEVKHQRHTQQGQQPYLEEMWRGKFQRTFTLPIQVDANNASANFENGILTLTLPKSEATKPRKIQVQARQTISGQSSQQSGSQSEGSTSGSSQGSSENIPVTSGKQNSGNQ